MAHPLYLSLIHIFDTYDKVIGSKEIKKMIQQIRGELPIDGVDLNDAQDVYKRQ